jgi:ligand-binding sensor domain-containing protein
MIDETGNTQAYWSTNGGNSFAITSGLPAKKRINMAKQLDINGNLYIGTDSAGLYKFSGNTFQRTGLGLPANARIWDITHKRNTYLTGETKDYLFLATDMGLYMSENNDTDWKLVRNGQFVNVL